MPTTIHSNGSKWAGQEPDSVADLLAVLAVEPLDPTFEAYGNFAYRHNGAWRFFGNFLNVSHVFNIDSDDPGVVTALRSAIRANKRTPAYRAARAESRAERRARNHARTVAAVRA